MKRSKMNYMRDASALLTLALLTTSSTVHAQTAATVNVNSGSPLATIGDHAYGANEAIWIPNLLDPALPGAVQPLNLNTVRWPGGSTGDVYHWQTNTITPGQSGYANPSNTFDNFMSVMSQSAVPNIRIIANYGSNAAGTAGGDPNEAAGWVQYANINKKYGVKYWEIGNEVYGNGIYNSSWECDLHPDHSPTAYGQNAVQFIKAMKAVDPTIKIGVVLAIPGVWPDGQSPDWNSNVLAQCGTMIDAVVVHWYPQNPRNISDSTLLSSTSSIPSFVSSLRSLIGTYCGANAPNVEIWLTETNSVSSNPGSQTLSIVNSLFAADDVMSWLEQGTNSVDWWALHNGPNGTNASRYGDYGILSTGQSPEPPAETPTKTYYGLQMLKYVARAGDTMVSTSSTNSLVAAHAAKLANGNLSVLLVNKDPSNSYNVTVNLGGFSPAGTAQVYTYNNSSSAISASTRNGVSASFVQSVSPYSLTTLVMSPGVATVPSAPTGLSALGSANQSISLGWTASPGATSYNILRSTVSGGPYTKVGTTSNVQYTDSGLTNGTTYYYVVSATNSAGTSGNSNETSAIPAPIAAPTNLVASGGRGVLTVQWTQSTTTGITANRVYKSTTPGGPYTLVATISPTSKYTFTATSGVTLYCVVTAVTGGGESPYSNEASGTPK